MKQRPFIPPPKLSPPAAAETQAPAQQAMASLSAATQQALVDAQGLLSPSPSPTDPSPETAGKVLSVVRPPARVASWKVHADHVEFINPTIDLAEAVWLKHVFPHQQTRRLEPARAVVAHGLVLIEEYGLAFSREGASIRTVVKEKP